jgi:hypothetical protein
MVPGGKQSGFTKPESDSAMTLVRRYRLPHTVTALFLRLNGYLLLAKAYKTPVGAIDFVVLRPDIKASPAVRPGAFV